MALNVLIIDREFYLWCAMDLSLFDYHLPEGMIAQKKSIPRDGSNLFYIDARKEEPTHHHMIFRDMEFILEPGDLLILNRSRVIPARIPACKPTGGRAEILLLERKGANQWEALAGGRRITDRMLLGTGDENVDIRIEERLEEGKCIITFRNSGIEMSHDEVLQWLKSWGLMPTPPYIKKFLEDPEEYQTVYGDVEGSVAAPTAGLHFTGSLMRRLKKKGVQIEYLILHVGLGTFAPVKADDINDHLMEEEEFYVPDSVKQAVKKKVEETLKDGKKRIWAVGTTSMRTLESAFDRNGNCLVEHGRTDLFITPGHDFKLPYKGFITNFHLPKSTPLILVSAFHDRKDIMKAYSEAIEREYRFYSLGDSMLIRRG
jgi:S-adenosylmethionine:tRNA ribosyltransferase-isomerase